MSKNQEKNTAKKNILVRIGATMWRWTKRMFWGASKELTQDEILLYEYEKTITVYYGENSRSYHSTQDCQQMYDEKYTHTLFEALHKDGKKPCSACNPYNEADAREYLDSLK